VTPVDRLLALNIIALYNHNHTLETTLTALWSKVHGTQ